MNLIKVEYESGNISYLNLDKFKNIVVNGDTIELWGNSGEYFLGKHNITNFDNVVKQIEQIFWSNCK